MLSIKPSQGNAFIMQTAPGCIASGTDYYVNSRGMICTETTIGGFSKYRMGDPICCRIRQAVQYGKTLEDYVEILKKKARVDELARMLGASADEKASHKLAEGMLNPD